MKPTLTVSETDKLVDSFNVSSVTDHGGDERSYIISVGNIVTGAPSLAMFKTNVLLDLEAIRREITNDPTSCSVLRGACIEVGHFLESHHQDIFIEGEDWKSAIKELKNLHRNFGIVCDLLCNAAKHGMATDHGDKRAIYFSNDVKRATCTSLRRIQHISTLVDGSIQSKTELQATLKLEKDNNSEERIIPHAELYDLLLESVSLIQNYIVAKGKL